MINKKIANKFSDNNRIKKNTLFIDRFKPTKSTKILDIGASEKEYQINANVFEKHYPYPENITVLGVDNYKEFCKKYPKVKTIMYEGDTFSFKDKEFDICWCNAVLKHVGDRSRQKKFLKEVRRVTKSSFVTTPNKYFPIELHTRIPLLHYLPKGIFDAILNKVGKKWATGNYMHLLGLKDIKKLLGECNIEDYTIKKNRIFGFVVDFVIIF